MSVELETVDLKHFKATLAAIAESVVSLTVERDACEDLAELKGASLVEIHNAKQKALADPKKVKAAQEQYADLRRALSESGIASLLQGLVLDRQQKKRLN